MSFWQTPGGAATISAGASILDGAFGGDSGPNYGKIRKHSKKMYRIQREQYAPDMIAKVGAAKAAGLHPLFAMGGGASFQGGTVPVPPAGQSQSGSRVSDAVQSALSAYQGTQLYSAQKDLIDAQAELARSRALEQVTSNDNANEVVSRAPHGPDFNPAVQEIKKGEYDAFNPKHREQSYNVKSPVIKMRMGSQDVNLLVEELDQLTEDPAAVAASAYFYHGNKNIDWPLLWQEYRHGKFMLPRHVSGSTKKAFARMAKRNADRAAARRKKARRPGTSNQFYS